MSLQLKMVGVIVEDMQKSVEFYRRLGVDIPDEAVTKHHTPIQMGDLTFFLNSKRFNASWDPAKTEASGGYRIILEFLMDSPTAVDDRYQELTDYGYTGHVAPYITSFNMYFAMINDPDDNTILLSAELPQTDT